MFLGSFAGDFDGFQADVVAAIKAFKQAKVTQLLLDLTNNGGVCACTLAIIHVSMTQGLDRRFRVPWSILASIPFRLSDRLSVRLLLLIDL